MAPQLTDLPDESLASVFYHLDLESRVRISRVCPRFWDIVFKSYRVSIWLDVKMIVKAGSLDLFEQYFMYTDSLWLEIADERHASNLDGFLVPSLGLHHLALTGQYRLSRVILKVLVGLFPNLKSFRCDKDVSVDVLAQIPNLIPNLHKFHSDGCLHILGHVPTQTCCEALDALDDIPRVSIHSIFISHAEGPVFDHLASSRLAKNVRSLVAVFDDDDYRDVHCHSSMINFQLLGTLEIHHLRQKFSWLNPGLGAPNLKALVFNDCDPLPDIWSSNESSLPMSLMTISIRFAEFGGWVDFEALGFIAQRSNQLKTVVLEAPSSTQFDICCSKAVKQIIHVESAIEYLYISGSVTEKENDYVDELQHVLAYLLELSENLQHMRLLWIDLHMPYWDIGDKVVMKLCKEDLARLRQALPGCIVNLGDSNSTGGALLDLSDAQWGIVRAMDGWRQTGLPARKEPQNPKPLLPAAPLFM